MIPHVRKMQCHSFRTCAIELTGSGMFVLERAPRSTVHNLRHWAMRHALVPVTYVSGIILLSVMCGLADEYNSRNRFSALHIERRLWGAKLEYLAHF